MVKVIEKSNKEIEYDNKISKLETIAELTIPFKISIANMGVFLGIFDYSLNEMMFNVYPNKNEMTLVNKKYFDNAFKVAEEYEKQTGVEWTIKKDYIE
jgi:hypothetical protein